MQNNANNPEKNINFWPVAIDLISQMTGNWGEYITKCSRKLLNEFITAPVTLWDVWKKIRNDDICFWECVDVSSVFNHPKSVYLISAELRLHSMTHS